IRPLPLAARVRWIFRSAQAKPLCASLPKLAGEAVVRNSSKEQFQRQFDGPARVQSGRNLASGGCVDGRRGRGEGRAVRQVEKFGPKLERSRLSEAELFSDCEVELL